MMMMMLTKVVNESSFMTASEEEDHYKFTRNLTRWNQRAFIEELRIHRLLVTAPTRSPKLPFSTIANQFSAIYIGIFHKMEVQTVILRC